MAARTALTGNENPQETSCWPVVGPPLVFILHKRGRNFFFIFSNICVSASVRYFRYTEGIFVVNMTSL